jgi:hypothetical protein
MAVKEFLIKSIEGCSSWGLSVNTGFGGCVVSRGLITIKIEDEILSKLIRSSDLVKK